MQKAFLKIAAFITLLVMSVFVNAQKTDKVFLKNGDVVTGEIKSLKLAKLSFDMNGPGTISIKWEEVVRVTSLKTFQVTLQDGTVLLTSLDTFFFVTQHVGLNDIVEIIRIKKKFLQRLSGDINLGFNYNKSSDILQFNLSTSVTYREPKVETNLKLNNVSSKSSQDTVTSKKQDITLSYLKTLDNRFYLMSNLGWERNTQLGLVNRYLLAGGGGKMILNDNQQRLLTGIGLSFNREEFNDSSGYKSNIEGLIKIEFKKFRYSSPKVSIDAQYTLYPSLSDWGRIRMNLQLNTSFEIFKDFSTGLSFYDNFDNRPSKAASSKNDYGVSLNIGYTFGK